MFPWATRIAKQPKKLQENQKNVQKQKTQRFLRNVWAEDFPQRLCFLFQCCFGLTPVFCLGFWIQKLSSVTMIAKKKHLTSKINAKIKKPKNPKDSQECLGPIFSLYFYFPPFPSQKETYLTFKRYPYHPWLCFFCFVQCLCRRSQQITKSSSWGRGSGFFLFYSWLCLASFIHVKNINHNIFLVAAVCAKKTNNRNTKHKKQ